MSKNQTFEYFQIKSCVWLKAEARKAVSKSNGTRIDADDLYQDALLAAWRTISTSGSQELAASRTLWAIHQAARKAHLTGGRELPTNPSEMPESADITAEDSFVRIEAALELVNLARKPVRQAWALLQSGSASSWAEAAEMLCLSRYQIRDGLRALAPRRRQQVDLADLPLFLGV